MNETSGRIGKGLLIFLLLLLCLTSVLAADFKSSLTPAELASDDPILVKMPSYDVLKQDSASMKVDDSVLSYKDADLAELAIKGGKVKFGFKSAGTVTVSNIVRCDGAKTYTEYNPVGKQTWIYWNPVWQVNGYNDVYDPDTKKSIKVPSYSNLVKIDCQCEKTETRIYEECPTRLDTLVSVGAEEVTPLPGKEAPIDILPIEECKEVTWQECVLYTAHISFPFDGYDPLIETNTPSSITSLVVTGDAYNDTSTNWTAYPIATDPDASDAIFNSTWFTDNEHGKNVSFLATLDQPIPSNTIDNTSLTMSGFVTYSGQMGNSSIGDSAEPTIIAGKYGRGMGFDGVNDLINITDNILLRPDNNSFTISFWIKTPFNCTGVSSWCGIISKGLTSSGQAGAWGFLTTNKNANQLNFIGSTTAGGGFAFNIQSGALSDGWHYITGTRTSDINAQLYIDGTLIGTDTSPNSNLSNTANIQIGTALSTYYTNTSAIDDILYRNCNITSSQINRSMISGGFPIDFTSEGGCAPTLFYGFENTGNGFVNDTNYLVNPNSDGSINNKGGAYLLDGVNDRIDFTKSTNTDADRSYSFVITPKSYTTNPRILDSLNVKPRIYISAQNLIKVDSNDNLLNTINASRAIIYGNTYKIDILINSTEYIWIYINGILNGSGQGSTSTGVESSYYLGNSNALNRAFNGSIDEVKIRNYLPSPAQILLDYNSWLANSSSVTLSMDETTQGENWTAHSKACDYSACSSTASKTLFITDCDQPYANTSWSYINSSCQFNASSNFYQFNRTHTTYFTGHFCLSAANTTFWEYNASVEEGCDYCGYQVNDTGYLSWLDEQACQVTDLYQQNRTNTSYDMNYTTCCAVTSFASDCYNNVTSTQYRNSSCNYCSYDIVYSTYSEWSNITDSCGNITRSFYDNAWQTCCYVTNISTDCVVNDTSAGNYTYHEQLGKPCNAKDGEKMTEIAIILVGVMFFLIYMANSIKAKDEDRNIIAINAAGKLILYALAGFISFFLIQMAVGWSLTLGNAAISSNTLAIYHFAMALFIVLGVVFLYGTIGNLALAAVRWVGDKFGTRGRRR